MKEIHPLIFFQYSGSLSQMTCPANLTTSHHPIALHRICRLARLSISHVMTADDGIYKAHVTGDSDCFPCSGEQQLRVIEDHGIG